jgi:hypothetical protein
MQESFNICVRRAAEPKMRRSPPNVRMLPEREWIELLQLQESLYAKRRRILYPEEKARSKRTSMEGKCARQIALGDAMVESIH